MEKTFGPKGSRNSDHCHLPHATRSYALTAVLTARLLLSVQDERTTRRKARFFTIGNVKLLGDSIELVDGSDYIFGFVSNFRCDGSLFAIVSNKYAQTNNVTITSLYNTFELINNREKYDE
jgi:hypothetical protein